MEEEEVSPCSFWVSKSFTHGGLKKFQSTEKRFRRKILWKKGESQAITLAQPDLNHDGWAERSRMSKKKERKVLWFANQTLMLRQQHRYRKWTLRALRRVRVCGSLDGVFMWYFSIWLVVTDNVLFYQIIILQDIFIFPKESKIRIFMWKLAFKKNTKGHCGKLQTYLKLGKKIKIKSGKMV